MARFWAGGRYVETGPKRPTIARWRGISSRCGECFFFRAHGVWGSGGIQAFGFVLGYLIEVYRCLQMSTAARQKINSSEARAGLADAADDPRADTEFRVLLEGLRRVYPLDYSGEDSCLGVKTNALAEREIW